MTWCIGLILPDAAGMMNLLTPVAGTGKISSYRDEYPIILPCPFCFYWTFHDCFMIKIFYVKPLFCFPIRWTIFFQIPYNRVILIKIHD